MLFIVGMNLSNPNGKLMTPMVNCDYEAATKALGRPPQSVGDFMKVPVRPMTNAEYIYMLGQEHPISPATR